MSTTTDAVGRFANPQLECDIVMKGGITSGVVYPGAIESLAPRYRFRSIGGTSAGGIAAAIVAAAEHAADRDAAFRAVADLPKMLAGDSFMLQLFQPERANRALFRAMLGFLTHGPGGALALPRAFPRYPLVALALALTSVALGVLGNARGAFVAGGVAIAVGILFVGVAVDAIRAFVALSGTDFGLCRLGPCAGTEGKPALTAWLHERIQTISGRKDGRPLSFADLWGVPAFDENATPEAARARTDDLVRRSITPDERVVDLQMMTTSLTHGRPMRLPVPFQPRRRRLEEGGNLFYDPAELERFFPPDVMAHLERCSAPLSDRSRARLPVAERDRTLRRFPIGPDLPVVVATRMTLSFPVLIAAVPLWELRYEADSLRLRRVVFSDGGITSNFPVHFFDSPLPTRPTFALNLTGFATDEEPDPDNPCSAVVDPADVTRAGYERAADIDSMSGFFTAIKDAAQNWRDNTQARLPGFRERVVHIKLGPKEGGLNLTMKPGKITELSRRGACAGERLAELFSGPPGAPPTRAKHWNDSRFARYRVAMGVTERWLRRLQRGYTHDADLVSIPYAERIAEGRKKPYAFPSNAALAFAEHTTTRYVDLVESWDSSGDTVDGPGVPRPPATLRAVPPV